MISWFPWISIRWPAASGRPPAEKINLNNIIIIDLANIVRQTDGTE
jgi:hypothetical protein